MRYEGAREVTYLGREEKIGNIIGVAGKKGAYVVVGITRKFIEKEEAEGYEGFEEGQELPPTIDAVKTHDTKLMGNKRFGELEEDWAYGMGKIKQRSMKTFNINDTITQHELVKIMRAEIQELTENLDEFEEASLRVDFAD